MRLHHCTLFEPLPIIIPSNAFTSFLTSTPLTCSDPVTLGHFSRINIPHLQVFKFQNVEVSVGRVDYEL